MHIVIDMTNYHSVLNLTLIGDKLAADVERKCDLGEIPPSILSKILAPVSTLGRYLFLLRFGNEIVNLEIESLGNFIPSYNDRDGDGFDESFEETHDEFYRGLNSPVGLLFKLRKVMEHPIDYDSENDLYCIEDCADIRVVAGVDVAKSFTWSDGFKTRFMPLVVEYYQLLCERFIQMSKDFNLSYDANCNIIENANDTIIYVDKLFIAWYKNTNPIDL